jgi:amino acid adenylation domain-containing protein
MNDLAERLSALSPAKRELLLRRLNERKGVEIKSVSKGALSSVMSDDGEEYEAPRTLIEEMLAGLWAEALGREKVGISSDFFKLGGHSLLATQSVARINEIFSLELPIVVLFSHPTISQLAGEIESGHFLSHQVPSIVPTDRNAHAPISYTQERIWFLNQLDPDGQAYNISRALRFFGQLNVGVLERAFTEVVRRHEILRTSFPLVDGQPIQVVHPPWTVALPVVDLTHVQESERPQEIEHQYRAAQAPFDLAKVPLIRLRLLMFSLNEYTLILSEHHLLHDGWTQGVLIRELITFYAAFVKGEPSPLPEPSLQYSDFARWQRTWLDSGVMEEQLGYWKRQLRDAPVLSLPSDRPRSAARTSAGDRYAFQVSAQLSNRLRALAKKNGATLFMVFLAAFKILLARRAGVDDICVGTGIANRRRKESESILGMFVNTVVFRTRPTAELRFSEYLRQMRDVCIDTYAHQDVPFNKVVEAVHPERSLSHLPLCQVLFSFHDSPAPRLKIPDVRIQPGLLHNLTAKFDLNIIGLPFSEQHVGEIDDEISQSVLMLWEYATDLFDRATVKRMASQFMTLLDGIVADPEARIGDVTLLAPAERRLLLEEWNNTSLAYPKDQCLHELFGEQAAMTPDAVALTYEGSILTYGQLDRRSNQLAHYLRQLGVGPEVVVGLCVERSLDLVVGLLGILKAGGAYLPLDPNSPEDRLSYMIADARVSVIVTHGALMDQVPGGSARIVRLDVDWPAIAALPETAPRGATLPDNLAYVIYTSGSAGRPKGTLISHDCVVRLLKATEARFDFSPADVWTLFHSYAFDFSVWEIWGALAYGGRVVVVPSQISRMPDAYYALLCREGVTILNQTPSAFAGLSRVALSQNAPNKLRLVIFGGEALSLESLKPWFERYGDEFPRLVNMYGITETTVHVTCRPLGKPDLSLTADSVIGLPIADLQIYVLEPGLQPAPIGVAGELYVGGAGLARGYLGRAGLTADRFVPSPFGDGERLYRTGDLAHWRSDGDLEYLGRSDHQIKIRGFRIELGEIETRLVEHSCVHQAVVVAREDASDDKRLVAYVVGSDAVPPDGDELRAHLKRSLPEYMVPSAYVVLEALPLTSNGKVDRRALPAPAGNAVIQGEYVAPRTPIEEVLAGIWAEVLKLERVGVHDNFFDLGGHSLLAMRVVARIRGDLEVELPLRAVFEAPSVGELAGRLLRDLAESIAEQSASDLIDEVVDLHN